MARVNNLGDRNGAPKQLHSDMCLVSPDNIYLSYFSIGPQKRQPWATKTKLGSLTHLSISMGKCLVTMLLGLFSYMWVIPVRV